MLITWMENVNFTQFVANIFLLVSEDKFYKMAL